MNDVCNRVKGVTFYGGPSIAEEHFLTLRGRGGDLERDAIDQGSDHERAQPSERVDLRVQRAVRDVTAETKQAKSSSRS